MTAPHPRSLLASSPQVYEVALAIAERLDQAGLDLWASGVRGCLDELGSTDRQRHLAAELVRLRGSHRVIDAGCAGDIELALERLNAALGEVDGPLQPIYVAMRELADHLELEGGQRWLARLRAVMADPDRSAQARVQRLGAVLELMEPGTEGLPTGSTPLVRAVLERLPRQHEVEELALFASFAFRPPTASRVKPQP